MEYNTNFYVSLLNRSTKNSLFREVFGCIQILIILTLSLELSGCASIPIEKIQTYTWAYEQVRIGGDLVYDQIAPLVKKGAEDTTGSVEDCAKAENGYPNCFDPALVLSASGTRTNEEISIRARRVALAAVTQYNIVLLDLANGKTADEARQRIEQLTEFIKVFSSIGAVANPGVAALVTSGAQIAGTLAERLERARANAIIRKSLIESKGDIQHLYQLLIDDTSKIYRIYVSSQEIAISEFDDLRNRARINRKPEQQAAYEKEIAGIQAQIRTFHASLGAYVNVLHKSSAALDDLVQTASNQTFSIREATEIARETGELSAKAEEFLNLIRAVRKPPLGST